MSNARMAWALLAWAVKRVGYWVRPYSMVTDSRRWFWQRRTHCAIVRFPPGVKPPGCSCRWVLDPKPDGSTRLERVDLPRAWPPCSVHPDG